MFWDAENIDHRKAPTPLRRDPEWEGRTLLLKKVLESELHYLSYGQKDEVKGILPHFARYLPI